MNLNTTDIKPIYIQIAEGIEDDILNGVLQEESECYSQYQISRMFNINPATAAKGINILVQEGILYKVRGLGMHVSKGAKAMICEKRRPAIAESVRKLLLEAEKLDISKEELIQMIRDATIPEKEDK
ncbi:MAG TPA: GntR family transcriptional regulator [Thermoclostridium sp.]|nr:GntR family transcriptional regulator [Thermoclostridium sp.]HPU45162.1 GntR family transcriptional regulator [Thermoclostridium sp.]